MHYFAYGSNMVLEQMRRLCGWHFQVLGDGFLEDFKLGPDTRGYLTVQPKKGEKVYGVIYKVDQKCIDALDEFEGHPEVFVRTEVQLSDMSGQKYSGCVYMEKEEFFGGSFVKAEYLSRVIGGAKEHGLPQEWVSFLMAFEKS
jgi:gamma-glutamylcyclotransferase (GGCT)/AIG2-like uncharacterized protein YtfP